MIRKSMKIFIIIILVISFQINSFGQSDIVFVWDNNASSIANADNLISAHRILYEFENKNIKLSYWKEDNWKRKSFGIGYRLAKTVLLDFQIDYLTYLLQHEVFGHGYRYREFEYKDNSYNISMAFPYGKGGGFARWGFTDYNRQLGEHEEIIIRSGGMEATTILSKTLQRKWLIRGDINYRESLLYLLSLHDYTSYIIGTKLSNTEDPRNDVDNYLRTVNASYGYTSEDTYQLTLNDITKRTSVNLINTFQLFAIYTYLKVYLFDGEERFSYPMVNLGSYKWLPSIRFGLTPFGSEFIIENYFKTENSILQFDFRFGDNKLDSYWGGGLSYYRNISQNIQIGSFVDFWNQPIMELGGKSKFNTNEGYGGRIIGEINLQFNNSFPIGIYSQIGYKTAGFIEGEMLNKGLIMRIGMSIKTKYSIE